MDPEERRMLAEIEAKVDENGRVLKSLHRTAHLAYLGSLIKWIVILGAFAISYYFAIPYINPLIQAYQAIQSESQSIHNSGSSFASTTASWEQAVADYFKKK